LSIFNPLNSTLSRETLHKVNAEGQIGENASLQKLLLILQMVTLHRQVARQHSCKVGTPEIQKNSREARRSHAGRNGLSAMISGRPLSCDCNTDLFIACQKSLLNQSRAASSCFLTSQSRLPASAGSTCSMNAGPPMTNCGRKSDTCQVEGVHQPDEAQFCTLNPSLEIATSFQ
jgi:hypothetical protein